MEIKMNKFKNTYGEFTAFDNDPLVKEMADRAKNFSVGFSENTINALCPKASCQPGCEQGCKDSCKASCTKGPK
jgi:hypothetical protein